MGVANTEVMNNWNNWNNWKNNIINDLERRCLLLLRVGYILNYSPQTFRQERPALGCGGK